MDRWDKASRLFKENDLCLFFKKDGVLYGATETDRITFARMKNPESKEDRKWSKDATFAAYDLKRYEPADKGPMSAFGIKDMTEIEPVTQDEAEKELSAVGKSLPVIKDEEGQDQTFGEE